MKYLALLFACLSVTRAEAWDLAIGGESYGIGAVRSVLDAPLNPNNVVRSEGTYELGLDLRPEFTLSHESVTALTRPRLRPRWRAIAEPALQRDRFNTDLRFWFDEASLRWDPTTELRLVAGIHYFSWGPGELMSPSNPIFHFQWDSRSIIFRQRGKALVRATWLVGQNASLTALAEPIHDDETPWLSSAKYVPRGLLRAETSIGAGTASAALVIGRMEREAGFVGWSASTYLNDAWSVYGDARYTLGRIADRPLFNAGNVVGMGAGAVNTGPVETLTLLGVRYEGFFDTRLEYIWNSYGYSKEEFSGLVRAARMAPYMAGAAGRPGLELPQKHYMFLSLRTDRLASADRFRLALRYLHSLVDHSGAFFGAAEWSFADRWTWIVEPGATHGADESEFRQAVRWELQSELRLAF